jgi:uncharacterized protein
MPLFSNLCGLVLTAYLCYETAVSRGKYQQLKLAIARGEAGARARFYRDILVFECVSAVLAFAALRFDPSRFDPSRLELGETAFGNWFASEWEKLDTDALTGFLAGAIGASAVLILLLWRSARRRTSSAQPTTPSGWRRILPDFGALLPTTMRERLIFVLVALSAGLCEEVVFRAWLLDVLHQIGLRGLVLVGAASAVFGLAHYYQGIFGVVVTGLLAVVFCGLYFASGTLWVPIVIHAIVDLRAAVMPSPYAVNRPPASDGAASR